MTSEEPRVSNTGRFTITGTCAVLGICYNTLMKYVRTGDIVPLPIGGSGRMRFKGSEIIRFWRSR